ncbi:MAG: hypothetical protein FJ404_14465 [Verrucomicrobia bacterium]|nr:hypothetical protein [Verrucomicrobiota bacterium]
MKTFRTLLIGLLCAGTLVRIQAAGPFTPPGKQNPTHPSVTNAAVTPLGGGEFRIGLIQFRKDPPSIRFPATLNMTRGILEYVLVHADGKTHESLLKTDAQPLHLHLAALLSGLAPGTNNPGLKTPTLLRLTVEATLENGTTHPVPPELWIQHKPAGKSLSPGPWQYLGSRTSEGVFLAQRDGSIISLITDPDALIGNPRPDRDGDDAWHVDSSSVPPLHTPVRVRLERWKP